MKYTSKVLYIIVLIIGIILGLIIRSWNGINWGMIDYGSVADWFSGIGTILAILSSIFIFVYSNRAKLIMHLFSDNDGSILELRVMNEGRTTGMYRYHGIKEFTGRKESLTDFLDMKYKDDAHYTSVLPGEISGPRFISVGEMYSTIGKIPQKNVETCTKFDVAIIYGKDVLQIVTVVVENGKILKIEKQRIRK